MPRFCHEMRGIVRPPSKSLVIPQSYQPKRFLRIAGGDCRGGSVTPVRLLLLVAAPLVASAQICAAQTQVPLPQAKPAAIAPAPTAKATEHKAAEHKGAEHKAGERKTPERKTPEHKTAEHKTTEHKEQAHKGAPAPLSLAPGALRGTTAAVPNPAGRATGAPPAPAMPPPLLR